MPPSSGRCCCPRRWRYSGDGTGGRHASCVLAPVSAVALDMTNFATYIGSTNDRADIAQRGKATQKSNDLRMVGPGPVITRDGGIPFPSHAYPRLPRVEPGRPPGPPPLRALAPH